MKHLSELGDLLGGAAGEAVAMAARILVSMAEVQGTDRFVEVESAHVDGCLFHGASGVEFAERLVELGGRVRVPTSLNVGAMDLRKPANVLLEEPERDLAVRLMQAYVAMGCRPSWTCAPYQAGFRPRAGSHVAWAESNAVVFANSVLGARTERYGDFMDICCALTGLAPYAGLHRPECRRARVRVQLEGMDPRWLSCDAFYPILGAWLGRVAGSEIAVIEGLPPGIHEDQLKALGAAAASTGAVGLFHVAGVTPEAPDVDSALGGQPSARTLVFDAATLREARDRMSTATGRRVDVVAVGSPHFSLEEFERLLQLMDGRRSRIPFHACTGRHVVSELERRGWLDALERGGVNLVTDTCVVVTPVIRGSGGVLMTNSGKFAHYSESLTGHRVAFGSLEDCVATAMAGELRRDSVFWAQAS